MSKTPQRKPVSVTINQVKYGEAANLGICTSCGEEQDGCEPDARNYTCDMCGKKSVYGYPQAVLEQKVTVE